MPVDIAVHSMKDVPTALPIGIVQAAVLERANTLDILVHKGNLDFLNSEGTIATGSLRRQAQWLNKYPNHKVVDLRGNVNTRMQKLEDSDWNGAIFAAAGLERINLKPENYIEAAENENTFAESPTDIALKRDHSNYRVLDMRGGIQNAFNGGALVAYHHNTVGGYNPAKLSIYQDLIENQWYKFPNCLPVVNMMNTKYVITGNIATDTLANPQALGNVWFVKGIAFKKGPAEVMSSLSNFNPKDTAIIEEKDKSSEINAIAYDSASTIRLIENKNDIVTYTSNASQN